MQVKACETFVTWSRSVEDEGEVHVVRLVTPEDPRLGVRFGYSCDCGEEQPCVHVLIAQGFHCGWHSEFWQESPTEDGRCPQCGGPLLDVSWSP